MAKEVLTKLSNDDLAQVCGGQIYAATEGNVTKYFTPTPPKDKYRARVFDTEQKALEYTKDNGLWMDTTPCESYHQATAAAVAKSDFYYYVNNVPFNMNARKWEDQYEKLISSKKVSPFSYQLALCGFCVFEGLLKFDT